MAAYRLSVKPSAVKEIDAIDPKRERRRIVTRIDELAIDPRPVGCERLVGPMALFRIRQGSYRVVHRIDDSRRSVEVIKVGHRRDVHRRNA